MAEGGSGSGRKVLAGLVAGSVAGGLEAVAMWPTEYVKTQLQLQHQQHQPRYRGAFHCAAVTVRETGLLSLYRGLSPVLIASFPKAGVRFGSFEQFKGLLQNDKGEMSAAKNFVAGMGAGACEAIFVVAPSETIKVKFMHDQSLSPSDRRFKGLVHGIGVIIRTEGIGGIYQGVVPTVLKQSSNQAIRFLTYNEIKLVFQGWDRKKKISPLETATAGALAGVIGVLANNPIDTVKTRMQGLNASKYSSSWNCAVSIFKQEGFLAFYRGVGPRLTRIFFGQAIIFTTYEQISQSVQSLLVDEKE